MARLVHYVVVVDLETGEVSIDNDTADARFPDGLLWDDHENEWRGETEDELHEGYKIIRPLIYGDE
jgi:hypothetical protein